MKRRVCAVCIDRANYARMKPLLESLKANPEIELQLVVGGSMLLERFGQAERIVEKDGFTISERLFIELEGSTNFTMTKSIGIAVSESASVFKRLDPDFVLIIGDRFEALGVAISAVFQNYCLIHVQGGEVTGTIDESTRHAISKLAHYHFPSTERSRQFLIRMGESAQRVFNMGCPSADVAKDAQAKEFDSKIFQREGVGANIDFDEPFSLVLFHPVTTSSDSAYNETENLLQALEETRIQTIMLWPNIDAGSGGIAKAIREFRERGGGRDYLRLHKNFSPVLFLQLMDRASVLVGNSSSFIRDASFFGTPVVLIGDRQASRERAEHVISVPPAKEKIKAGIVEALAAGRAEPSTLYGEPGAAKKICEVIASLEPFSQKILSYDDLQA